MKKVSKKDGVKSIYCRAVFAGLISLMILLSVFTPIVLSSDFDGTNQPPVAILGVDPSEAGVGEIVYFDGSGSYDSPDSDPESVQCEYLEEAEPVELIALSSNPVISANDIENADKIASISDDIPSVTINDDSVNPDETRSVFPVIDPDPREPVEPSPVLSYRFFINKGELWDTGWQNSPTATYVFDNLGTYTVTLEVMDDDGANDSTNAIVEIVGEVDDEPPSKVGNLAVSEIEGGLSLSWDRATDNVAVDHYNIYRFDLWGPFTSPTNTFDDSGLAPGTYTYQVSAVDSSGNEGEKSDPRDGTTTGVNIPPVADASAGEPYFQWHEPITFDASNSYDPDGYITGYRWDFDSNGEYDTDWLSTPIHVYRYSDVGTYNVTLQVQDNQSATDTDSTTATVVKNNDPPIADAGGPYYGRVNISIMFNGSGSYDPDGTIISYFWEFGDGANGTGVTPIHTYTKNGTYNVTLTVTDNSSRTNTITTFANITDKNMPPSKPELTIRESDNKNEFILTAVSIDPEGDNISYIIDWGDNTTTTPPPFPSGTLLTTTHIYTFAGTYNITVFARDEHNATSEKAEVAVIVNESIGEQVYDQSGDVIGPLLDDVEMRYAVIGAICTAIALIAMIVHIFKRKSYDM